MSQEQLSFEYIEHLRDARIASRTVPGGLRGGLPAPLASDELDNNVHPIFARLQFLGITDTQYQLLIPALRLATNCITEECLQFWWVKILFGKVENLGSEATIDTYFNSPPREDDCENARGFQQFLMSLVTMLKFVFDPLKAEGVSDADAMAFANEARCKAALEGSGNEDEEAWVDEPRIALHSRFVDNLEYLTKVNGSQAQFEVAYFMLTKAIVHELAHIVYMVSLGEACSEPFFSKADMEGYTPSSLCAHGGELGWSWEMHMFGAGFTWSIEHPRSLSIFRQRQYTNCRGQVKEDRRRMIVIPNWWVSLWFRKSVWQNMAHLRARGELRVPSEAESGFVFHWNDGHWDLMLDGQSVAIKCKIRGFFLQDVIERSDRKDSAASSEQPLAQTNPRAIADVDTGAEMDIDLDTDMDRIEWL